MLGQWMEYLSRSLARSLDLSLCFSFSLFLSLSLSLFLFLSRCLRNVAKSRACQCFAVAERALLLAVLERRVELRNLFVSVRAAFSLMPSVR